MSTYLSESYLLVIRILQLVQHQITDPDIFHIETRSDLTLIIGYIMSLQCTYLVIYS